MEKITARTARIEWWHYGLHISHPGGVYGKNTFYKFSGKIRFFRKIVKSNPIPLLKGQ